MIETKSEAVAQCQSHMDLPMGLELGRRGLSVTSNATQDWTAPDHGLGRLVLPRGDYDWKSREESCSCGKFAPRRTQWRN